MESMIQRLDFEKPIGELEKKIEELRHLSNGADSDLSHEILKLEHKCARLTQQIFSRLNRWQRTQLARHPNRPYALDYIQAMTTDFLELHGDRLFGDDPAIVGGVARLEGRPLMIIGQQKGRSIKEKIHRNFGMPHPEGFRKALRLLQLADKFHLPVVTLIDTSGAYPGIGAEERGQAEAIARNLRTMAELRVPVVSVVIGEGGSGGALALGVSNRVLMLEYAIYTVITPEGCAAILWDDSEKAPEASEALKITAQDLLAVGAIDGIIPEPLGGAHREPREMAARLQETLARHLAELAHLSAADLVRLRHERFRRMGVFKGR
ncbi:MAG: acetyl-CoA carboxylase carboxyltransferase subunit alpha [Candidatus Tectomicrobia bacterium]|uniref:Acetyl-coenzyme A carboxylase carboxyl transferase subunit alpha n=1 Tax=Tectimicrobiota bacterium TaxID=2528274 RepID=A0A932CQI4_UNCTE|nr:acetyl-CoA carboxylase carboxyltransferase subunit alpha [Candidatus Tectomicrobia bacterium]